MLARLLTRRLPVSAPGVRDNIGSGSARFFVVPVAIPVAAGTETTFTGPLSTHVCPTQEAPVAGPN
jgi:hypothetical protein